MENAEKNTKMDDVLLHPATESAFTRLVYEKNELDVRIQKLIVFTKSDKFMKCKEHARNLLYRQLDIMLDYSDILNRRILTWEEI